MKVIAIGGYPGSGKSYIVKKLIQLIEVLHGSLWTWEEHKPQEFPSVLYTQNSNLIIMGTYKENELFPGTDRLSMGVQPSFQKFLLSKKEEGVTILFEGDRLFNGATIRFLYENKIPYQVVIISAEQATVNKRRQARSEQNETWRKGRQSKVDNIARQCPNKIVLPNNSELESEQAVEILISVLGEDNGTNQR